jgi:hypothetical protein
MAAFDVFEEANMAELAQWTRSIREESHCIVTLSVNDFVD